MIDGRQPRKGLGDNSGGEEHDEFIVSVTLHPLSVTHFNVRTHLKRRSNPWNGHISLRP